MVSLKQLTYALAIERHLRFNRAAEECAISQSTLSAALAEMERQLGFQVFERDNKKVLVTALGQQVLEKARLIKEQLDELHGLAQAHKQPLSTPVSIGLIPTIGPFLLPVVLPALQEHYPQLELNITEERSHVLVDAVRSGTLDAAVLALPYRVDGLLTFKFWDENFFWVTHADDEKARLTEIRPADIDSRRLMLLKDGHCLKDHALAVCNLSNIAPQNLGSTSLSTLVQLVAGTIGSTLVPHMAMAGLVDSNPRVSGVPLAEPGPHRSIAFLVRPNYPLLKNIELLMELFATALRQRFD
ncbi:MAG: LysR family transcriptional regulator [Gammaproteobacteria bacterium]|nr:LysR family transcriptional regulator [Gammaproteobacteria bacterium]